MIHGSLFTGIGGFDLAAQWAGIKTVWQCEKDEYCRRVLERHFPEAKRYDDIKLLRNPEAVDIISGGFPCQPFSVAGKRRGKEDDRFLWPEMLRVISEVRPNWVIGENVAGIVNMELDRVLSDLEAEGYSCQAFIIPAVAVDAKHRRERVWIVGYANGADAGGNNTGARTGIGLENGKRILAPTGWEQGEYKFNSSNKNVSDTTDSRAESLREWKEPADEIVADSENRRNVRGDWWMESVKRKMPGHNGSTENGSWERWPVEPDVGRAFNGLSGELDKIGGLSDEAKRRAREILSNVRIKDVEEAVQWHARRFSSVSKKEILLAFLCEYEEKSNRFRDEVEGREVEERCLRNLWRTIESSRSPYRWGYKQQFAIEYSDALWKLSCNSPSLMPEAWSSGCWEDGVSRVEKNIPNRVDRLRALGNAIVPQVAYQIFRAIVAVEEQIKEQSA